MFCIECGTELPYDASFCHMCGTKVTQLSVNETDEVTNEQISEEQNQTVEILNVKDTESNDKKEVSEKPETSSEKADVSSENNEIYNKLMKNSKSCKKIKSIVCKDVVSKYGGIVYTNTVVKGTFFKYTVNSKDVSEIYAHNTLLNYIICVVCAIFDGIFTKYFFEEEFFLPLTLCVLAECILWFVFLIYRYTEQKEIVAYINKTIGTQNTIPKAFNIISGIINSIIIIMGIIALAYSISDIVEDNISYTYNNSEITTQIEQNKDNVSTEKSSVENEPTSSIQNKLYREEMFFEGEYQSTLTLYPDGQFDMLVNLYEGMGNIYGAYIYLGDDIVEFYIYDRNFSGFLGDDVVYFNMQISDNKLIYSSSDFIGYVSKGMEFLLCDNGSVSQNQSQTESVITEQGIYPEYIYLLNEFYNHTTYKSSNSEYTMFLPYVNSNEMGYTIMDIDGNGVSELIIFWNDDCNPGGICSMFTLGSSGEIIPIIDGTGSRGNTSYHLCEKNNQYYIRYIWFEKTSPNGGYEYFRIDMDEEYMFDSVCSFGFDNSGETTRWYDLNTFETIAESEVTKLVNSYETVFIDFNTFSEYEPI